MKSWFVVDCRMLKACYDLGLLKIAESRLNNPDSNLRKVFDQYNDGLEEIHQKYDEGLSETVVTEVMHLSMEDFATSVALAAAEESCKSISSNPSWCVDDLDWEVIGKACIEKLKSLANERLQDLQNKYFYSNVIKNATTSGNEKLIRILISCAE